MIELEKKKVEIIPGEFGPVEKDKNESSPKEEKEPAPVSAEVIVPFSPDLPKDWMSKKSFKEKIDELMNLRKKQPGRFVKGLFIKKPRGPAKVRAGIIYRIPIIGPLIMQKRIQTGHVLAEIIFPNQRCKRYLMPMNKDYMEIEVENSIRFFNVAAILDHPERYVRVEDNVPLVTFYWNYSNPIPIRPVKSEIINLNTYGNLVLNQRSAAAAEPIKKFLDLVAKDIKLIKIMAIVAAAGGAATLAQFAGFL